MANYNLAKLSGETIAAILGGILAIYSFRHVVVAQVFASIALLFVSLRLTETKYEKMNKGTHLKNIKETINYLIKDKLIFLLFTNTTVWGLATFCAIWIFQKQWQSDGIDLKFFGYIWASYTLTTALVGKIVSYVSSKYGSIFSLLIISLFPLIGYIGMSTSQYYMAASFGYFFAISRAFNFVFLKDALNWKLQAKFRATSNSIMSLSFRSGFLILGPIVGYIIEHYGISNSYQFLLIFFSICFLLIMCPLIIHLLKNPEELKH